MFDAVFRNQGRQVGGGAENVEVAGPGVGLILDETDVLDAHPPGFAQGTSGFTRHSAGADDEAMRLVVALTAQVADRGPAQASGGQQRQGSERGEQHHRDA